MPGVRVPELPYLARTPCTAHTNTHTRAGVRSVQGIGWRRSTALLLTVCCIARTGPVHRHAATAACQLPKLTGKRHTLPFILTPNLEHTHAQISKQQQEPLTSPIQTTYNKSQNVIETESRSSLVCLKGVANYIWWRNFALPSHTCSLSFRMNLPGPFHLLWAWNTHSWSGSTRWQGLAEDPFFPGASRPTSSIST